MSRAEFTKATKLAAFKRANGHCEVCTGKLFAGHFDYHHDKECAFDGSNDLSNCVVACDNCHSKITKRRASVIAKSNRVRAAHLGIKRTGKPLPGTRASGWRRRMDGTVERR